MTMCAIERILAETENDLKSASNKVHQELIHLSMTIYLER